MNKRILAFTLFLVLLFSCVCLPIAAEPTQRPDTSRAVSVLVHHLDSDSTLYSQKANQKVYPAATVKIMVALVAIEYYSQIGSGLDTVVTVPAEVVRESTGLTMELRRDEEISVYDLLCGTVIGGANDAAYTLALSIDGSLDAFLARMNQKAKELGMKDTVYYNVSGLDYAPCTTANDLLTLAKNAFENKTYMKLASTARHTVQETNKHEKRTLYTRNYLLSKQTYANYYYAPATGMNAGATDAAGYCIVSSARIDNQNYICIIMGADRFENFTLAKGLFQWAGTEHGYKSVLSKKNVLAEIPVTLADACDYVTVIADRDITRFLPNSVHAESIEIKPQLYFDQLTAPVNAGMIVGKAEIYLDGEYLDSVQLITANALAKDHSSHFMRKVKNFLISPGFLLTLAIICFFGIAYVLVVARIRYLRMVKQVMEIPEDDEYHPATTAPKLPPKNKKERP